MAGIQLPGNQPRASRPRLPRDYGIPESEEGMLPWTWAEERLTAMRNYWLTTTRPDGAPHAMPVWAVWDDGALVFSTSPESQKGRNLARDPRVVIGVEQDDEVVVLEGQVDAITLDRRIADVYADKYEYRPEPENPAEGWYRLRPHVAYAWDRTYPRTATRFVFD